MAYCGCAFCVELKTGVFDNAFTIVVSINANSVLVRVWLANTGPRIAVPITECLPAS